MKKIDLPCCPFACYSSRHYWGQAPLNFNYQAVLRDAAVEISWKIRMLMLPLTF
jgi:hypothetical protein